MPDGDGSDRRRLMRLRESINEAPSRERRVLAGLARKLGVDRLEEIGPGRGRRITYQRMVCDFKDLEKRAKKSPYYSKRAEELPEHIRTMSLSLFMIMPKTLSALEQAGIISVEDFVMKSEKTLIEIHGLTKDVIEETRDLLYGYGIRTVDNPPKPDKGLQAH